eukprot:6757991-Prymnesium_polylepis.3
MVVDVPPGLAGDDVGSVGDGAEVADDSAAAALFEVEEDVTVVRAPGLVLAWARATLIVVGSESESCCWYSTLPYG